MIKFYQGDYCLFKQANWGIEVYLLRWALHCSILTTDAPKIVHLRDCYNLRSPRILNKLWLNVHVVPNYWNFQQANLMWFVDFASTFDSVDMNSLWQIMAADGMPPKLLRLIKAYYSSTKMKVRASWTDSMSFEIRSGVRQGCALPPTHLQLHNWLDSSPGSTRLPRVSGWS